LKEWRAAHVLDTTGSADDAYLPRVPGEPSGTDTWQILMLDDGRVSQYQLTITPTTLPKAQERARRELPADAVLVWSRTVPGKCTQQGFRSATLARGLGDGWVIIDYYNAVTGGALPVDQVNLDSYAAPTVAMAPACSSYLLGQDQRWPNG
jgi:hypothetical protein